MLKKIRESVKNFFKTPTLEDIRPALHRGATMTLNPQQKHNDDMLNTTLAGLRLQREALLKSLITAHRTMIITLIAVVISVLASAGAIVISVRSNNDVTVKVYEQETIQKN